MGRPIFLEPYIVASRYVAFLFFTVDGTPAMKIVIIGGGDTLWCRYNDGNT
ncbi:hypothetical protein Mal15_04840 [Stieleria maiorica]|uniref:Uncharacterized protein n=1 Tax=Stieleria maiorica TaxID=2795974 RepID=A0A5B9M8G1_9BACT|nr:hypothetical protein [Stieleria maiorica]QEF96456.1 hypothetical protein Mal15_04840 [Stieleria maiorica]